MIDRGFRRPACAARTGWSHGQNLIVENTDLEARQIAQALREAGHSPVLAPDARAAMLVAVLSPHLILSPELILLILSLPDLPGGELLSQSRRAPEVAEIPVLPVTRKTATAEGLSREQGADVADIPFKPVTNARLCQAVQKALGPPKSYQSPRPAPSLEEVRRLEVIRRLMVKAPGLLGFQIFRRHGEDWARSANLEAAKVLTWLEMTLRPYRKGS